jgi:hypothetical protein
MALLHSNQGVPCSIMCATAHNAEVLLSMPCIQAGQLSATQLSTLLRAL